MLEEKPDSATLIFEDHLGSLYDTGMLEPNLNILAHAQAIELDIGSRCGGHGVCGGDRLRILSGKDWERAKIPLSAVTAAEKEHFTVEELAAGWRLGCQCFPNSSDRNIRVLMSDPL